MKTPFCEVYVARGFCRLKPLETRPNVCLTIITKGPIPTIHAVVSEVSEELTDRKKRQVSSDFQSSFDKVKRNRSEFIIFWL